MTVGGSTLFEAFAWWAERQPDAPALVAEDKEPLRYARLIAMGDEFREALNTCGFGRGDRIGIVLDGGSDMAAAIVCVWGCATVVPLNPDLTEDEFSRAYRQLRVDAILTDRPVGTAAVRAASRSGLPVLTMTSRNDGVAGSIELKVQSMRSLAKGGPSTGDDIATVLITSGTTSRSKVVPMRHSKLLWNHAWYAGGLELEPTDRCLSLMPMFHGHGINPGLGLNLYSGGSVIHLQPFGIATFERYIRTLEPTWYTGAYTFQHQINAHADMLREAVAASRLRFARSGSGALHARVAIELEKSFGIPVIQALSSSETGLMAINPQPPRVHKPGSVGLPVDPRTRVVDEAGNALPVGEVGELVLDIACVFDGYENDPKANAEAFRDGCYHTGDLGYFDEDGYLFLVGRKKELINRGGEKIAPFEVEQELHAIPGVESAAVFPIHHPTLGAEVGAVIETRGGTTLSEVEVATALRETLAEFKVPRRFAFVDEIPKGPTGRVVRRDLAAALGFDKPDDRHADRDIGAERVPTALEARLRELWCEALKHDTVGLDEDFFLAGGDSLQAIELFLRIEQDLGTRLPRAILFEAGTIAEMAKKIAAYNGSPCLVRVSPRGSKPPVFFIHGGDGNAVYFRDLARYLGEDQPCYALQCVGLDGLEQPLTRIDDMVERYLPEIRAVQPHGPYYLAGFSFGGRVAYSLAQRLRADGEAVALLAMLDTYSVSERGPVGLWTGTRTHLETLARLPWREKAAFFAARLRNVGRVLATHLPEPVFAALRNTFLDGKQAVPHSLTLTPLEAHAMANSMFRPTPFDGDIVMFRAIANQGGEHDGWAALVDGRIEIHDVPGGHNDILGEPQVRILAQKFGAVLAERQARFEGQGPVVAPGPRPSVEHAVSAGRRRVKTKRVPPARSGDVGTAVTSRSESDPGPLQ
jgi:acyl-CoA synthetase (AMP-forming)/AMP-acid ligase II/thioesterase domain-containing protein/acyl carrier protein